MQKFIELINKKEEQHDYLISLFSMLYFKKIFLGQKIYDIDLIDTPGKFVTLKMSKEKSVLFEKSQVILN